jgi:hypothetical protein
MDISIQQAYQLSKVLCTTLNKKDRGGQNEKTVTN